MNAPFDRIFFISLKHHISRRSRILRHFTETGLKDKHGNAPVWWPANNGLNYPQQIDCTKRKTMVSRGEIGCYASHLTLYRHIAESNFKTVLILEDDAKLKPEAFEIFQNWSKVPEWEFINFALQHFTGTDHSHTEVNRDMKLYSGYGFWLTHAYAITKGCAVKLVDALQVQRGGLDWQLAQIQKDLKSFAFMGNPIFQTKSPSSIIHTRI